MNIVLRGMSPMYKTVLFDLDGTLTDPGEGITNSVAYALKKWGIEVEDRTTLYKFIGPPLLDSFARYYGFDSDKSMQALKFYREYFTDKGIFENELYEGVEEMLSALKIAGKTIGLATSKPEEFAVRILKHFHIDKYFDFVAGASMDETRNTKDAVIEYALKNYEINDIAETVMVGDREHDVLGAKQFGIDTIGVLFGYGDYEELVNAGAAYIAAMVEDILPIING